MLAKFDPMLTQIVSVANGDNTHKLGVENQLPILAQRGWNLTNAIKLFWEGERNLSVLQTGVDSNSAHLIARMVNMGARSAAAATN